MTDDRKSESEQILARIEQEAAGGGLLASGFAPGNKPSPDDDWIEQWGTRIGRGIGITAAAALCTWIVLYALNLI